MKERDVFFIIALASAVGVLGFWSLRLVEMLQASSLSVPENPGARGLVFSLPESPEVTQKEIFLAPLGEEEIANLRDIFVFEEAPSAFGEEEVVVSSEIPEEEVFPTITIKGVVLSPKNQVVVVEVDGEIFFLTPEKPLSGELRLVKVDKKQVVLTYRGREFVFSLEE